MEYYINPETCIKCGRAKYASFYNTGTTTLPICNCPKETKLAWECTRCHKINAPWRESCDCPSAGTTTIGDTFQSPTNGLIGDHTNIKLSTIKKFDPINSRWIKDLPEGHPDNKRKHEL